MDVFQWEQRTHLRKLALTYQGLTAIPNPDGLVHLTTLEQLYLPFNQISTIPTEVGHLLGLKQLHLNCNRISNVPSEIGNLSGLEVLALHGNNVELIPPQLGRLTQLKKLFLHSNTLREVCVEVGMLRKLKVLHINDNRLTSLPAQIGELLALKTLHAHGNALQHLPTTIGNLHALAELHLSRNQLEEVPIELSHLTNLTKLHIDENRLESLELVFERLKKLEVLSACHNRIRSWGSGNYLQITDAASLKTLNLAINELTVVPSTISKLNALKELYLYSNQISYLPPELRSLELHTLDIHSNKLIAKQNKKIGRFSFPSLYAICSRKLLETGKLMDQGSDFGEVMLPVDVIQSLQCPARCCVCNRSQIESVGHFVVWRPISKFELKDVPIHHSVCSFQCCKEFNTKWCTAVN